MSKRNYWALLPGLLAIPLGYAGLSMAEPTSETPPIGKTVEIAFTSVEPEEGQIWVGVCTKEQMQKRYRGDDIECAAEEWLEASNMARIVFDGLSVGTYVITAFHDENGNNTLDFDTRGIPLEATGNGNNAKGNYGPPTFEQMKFDLPEYSSSNPQMSYTVSFHRAGPPF